MTELRIIDPEGDNPHIETRAIPREAEDFGDDELRERMARLEGQTGALQWAVGIVSGVMLAAISVVVALQIHISGSVSSLENKVDALPREISAEIQAITSTLSSAITATNSSRPEVIVIPAPIAQVSDGDGEGQGNLQP